LCTARKEEEVLMDQIERIATLDNEVETRVLESELITRDIPHLMRSYHDSAYDGIYQLSMG
jgi:hypothetical protein